MEETTKSVNPMDLNQYVSSPFEPAKGKHDVLVLSTKALFKISQDMARVLYRITTLRALIDSVRKHGIE